MLKSLKSAKRVNNILTKGLDVSKDLISVAVSIFRIYHLIILIRLFSIF